LIKRICLNYFTKHLIESDGTLQAIWIKQICFKHLTKITRDFFYWKWIWWNITGHFTVLRHFWQLSICGMRIYNQYFLCRSSETWYAIWAFCFENEYDVYYIFTLQPKKSLKYSEPNEYCQSLFYIISVTCYLWDASKTNVLLTMDED
jgi:hypothetical protein